MDKFEDRIRISTVFSPWDRTKYLNIPVVPMFVKEVREFPYPRDCDQTITCYLVAENAHITRLVYSNNISDTKIEAVKQEVLDNQDAGKEFFVGNHFGEFITIPVKLGPDNLDKLNENRFFIADREVLRQATLEANKT